jgi:hypothetical protein
MEEDMDENVLDADDMEDDLIIVLVKHITSIMDKEIN